MSDFEKLRALQDKLDDVRAQLQGLLDHVAALANEIHDALDKNPAPQPDDDAEPDEVEPIVPEVPDEDDGA